MRFQYPGIAQGWDYHTRWIFLYVLRASVALFVYANCDVYIRDLSIDSLICASMILSRVLSRKDKRLIGLKSFGLLCDDVLSLFCNKLNSLIVHVSGIELEKICTKFVCHTSVFSAVSFHVVSQTTKENNIFFSHFYYIFFRLVQKLDKRIMGW